MDKMREEFEAFVINRMKESGFLGVEVRVEMLGVSSDGSYFDVTVDAWWDFWQASRAALCVKLPSFDNGSLRGYGGDCEEARAVVDSVAESIEKAGVRYE